MLYYEQLFSIYIISHLPTQPPQSYNPLFDISKFISKKNFRQGIALQKHPP